MTDVPAFDTASFRDTLVTEGAFSETQARVLTRAFSTATSHLPSKDGLEQFRSEIKALLADRLNEQTWKVAQLLISAVLFNALVVGAAAVALYNALRPG